MIEIFKILVMFYTTRAYVNSQGKGKVHNLNHDIKRALMDAKATQGLLNIVSIQATVGLKLIESDIKIQEDYFKRVYSKYKDLPMDKTNRRSYTGPAPFHYMAADLNLSLTLPIAQGRLASSAFHDIIAFDFEPGAGRREFIISVLADNPEQKQQQGRR